MTPEEREKKRMLSYAVNAKLFEEVLSVMMANGYKYLTSGDAYSMVGVAKWAASMFRGVLELETPYLHPEFGAMRFFNPEIAIINLDKLKAGTRHTWSVSEENFAIHHAIRSLPESVRKVLLEHHYPITMKRDTVPPHVQSISRYSARDYGGLPRKKQHKIVYSLDPGRFTLFRSKFTVTFRSEGLEELSLRTDEAAHIRKLPRTLKRLELENKDKYKPMAGGIERFLQAASSCPRLKTLVMRGPVHVDVDFHGKLDSVTSVILDAGVYPRTGRPLDVVIPISFCFPRNVENITIAGLVCPVCVSTPRGVRHLEFADGFGPCKMHGKPLSGWENTALLDHLYAENFVVGDRGDPFHIGSLPKGVKYVKSGLRIYAVTVGEAIRTLERLIIVRQTKYCACLLEDDDTSDTDTDTEADSYGWWRQDCASLSEDDDTPDTEAEIYGWWWQELKKAMGPPVILHIDMNTVFTFKK